MQSTSTKLETESQAEQTFVCDTCLGSKQYPIGWGRTHVPGVSVNLNQPNPDIMFIGEAPGADEDRLGKPFVGRAGQLLQKTLCEINITTNIYISNIIKHRPPNNRKPTMLEMVDLGNEICGEILDLKPKIIICLGRSPAEYMMWLTDNEKKGSLRGYQFALKQYDGNEEHSWSCPVLCTWHPAYILRNANKLPELKEDILNAIETIKEYNYAECTMKN